MQTRLLRAITITLVLAAIIPAAVAVTCNRENLTPYHMFFPTAVLMLVAAILFSVYVAKVKDEDRRKQAGVSREAWKRSKNRKRSY